MTRYRFDEEVEIARRALSPSTEVRVTLVPTSSGGAVVGLREWVIGRPGRYSGPTKRGFLLPPDAVEGIIVALNRAQRTLAERGLEV